MSDSRQTAYLLTLIGGIFNVAVTVLVVGVMAAVAGAVGVFGAAGEPEFGPGEAAFVTGIIALVAGIILLLGLVSGILLLVAAPRLRSADAHARRTWSVVAMVVGGVTFLTGNAIGGGLGFAGGLLVFLEDQRAAAA